MKKGGEWEFRQWEQMLGSVTRSENMKGMLRDWDADRSKLETDIESLTAKLEAATAALEEIQLVSYQRYGGIVTVDIAPR